MHFIRLEQDEVLSENLLFDKRITVPAPYIPVDICEGRGGRGDTRRRRGEERNICRSDKLEDKVIHTYVLRYDGP